MKPLPQRDVEAHVPRTGAPRLTGAQQKALGSIKDEDLKKALGELLLSTRYSQENFEAIEQLFPVKPVAYEGGGVTGIPFQHVVAGLANEIVWSRGGSGATLERKAAGVYWVTYDFEADAIFVFPQNEKQSVDWSVLNTHEDGTETVVVQTYRSTTGEKADAEFFFTAFAIGKAGNTIVGPEGPPGPTHKTLYHGKGAPAKELGEVDDFYIDTEAWEIYGPKTEAGWGEGVSIIGPAGPEGPVGKEGPAGPEGPAGKEGPAGPAGAGIAWKGAWDSKTEYAVDDAVSHNGSSYIATEANKNQEPHT